MSDFFYLPCMKYLIVLISMVFSISGSCQSSGEFVEIFDGKTLNGWTETTDNPGSFLVEDGMLVARGGRAHLFYDGLDGNADFKNFEYSLKVKTTAKSNSGVYFHTKYQADGWPKMGFEAQVNSMHSDPRKTGSLYNIVNMWAPENSDENFVARVDKKGEVFILRPAAPSTDGEWFDYFIKVDGNRIIVKVDGVTTVDWTQPKDWEREGRRIGSGTVAFQAHDPTCNVFYKDIKLKILD